MSNLKESSITIGGKNMNKLACITEASQQYAQPHISNAQTTVNRTKNQELKQYLKGHHFDFGLKTNKAREGLTMSQDPTVHQGSVSINMISK